MHADKDLRRNTAKAQHTPELLSVPTEEVPLWLSFAPVFQQLPPLKSTHSNIK